MAVKNIKIYNRMYQRERRATLKLAELHNLANKKQLKAFHYIEYVYGNPQNLRKKGFTQRINKQIKRLKEGKSFDKRAIANTTVFKRRRATALKKNEKYVIKDMFYEEFEYDDIYHENEEFQKEVIKMHQTEKGSIDRLRSNIKLEKMRWEHRKSKNAETDRDREGKTEAGIKEQENRLTIWQNMIKRFEE